MRRKKINFGLDSSLRYLYDTLRYMRCGLMAIEFEHRGKKYRADTAREAAELQALLDSQDDQRGRTRLKTWSADVTMEFLSGLGEMQAGFLSALAGAGNVPSQTIVEALRLDSEIALAGVLSGLSKQAKKTNINPHDLYVVETQWNGKKRERSFRLSEDFRDSLIEVGWPEDWKDEKKPK